MEPERGRGQKAEADHRRNESSPEMDFGPAPEERENRRYFSVAAGSLILALVAFVCGVQVGKTLSDLRGLEGVGSRTQAQKEQEPPFRMAERGKETQPDRETKPGSSEPGVIKGPKSEAPPPPAQKVFSEKASPPVEKLSPLPATPEEKKTPLPKGKYTLQVGAFSNPLEAQELAKQLKNKGYDTYLITSGAAAKRTLHRVRIGRFQTLQEARQFAQNFEKKENMKTIISNVPPP